MCAPKPVYKHALKMQQVGCARELLLVVCEPCLSMPSKAAGLAFSQPRVGTLFCLQELSVARAVDACCRLPFLRHTPLKVGPCASLPVLFHMLAHWAHLRNSMA